MRRGSIHGHLLPLLVLALLMTAVPAVAGPWPRAVGGVFLSFSTERDREDNSYTSIYSEYGLSARNTLGLELGHSNAGETSAILWWQRAMDRGEGPDRWALSSGIGAVERGDEIIPVATMGAAWGRGFDATPWLERVPGGGWLAVDLRVKVAGKMKTDAEIEELAAQGQGYLSYITPETTTKADLTLGWHVTPKMMLINQLRLEDRDDTGFASKLATSLVHDLYGPARVELGLILPVDGPGETAVKLGSWIEF